jgi:hypothetical protein
MSCELICHINIVHLDSQQAHMCPWGLVVCGEEPSGSDSSFQINYLFCILSFTVVLDIVLCLWCVYTMLQKLGMFLGCCMKDVQ